MAKRACISGSIDARTFDKYASAYNQLNVTSFAKKANVLCGVSIVFCKEGNTALVPVIVPTTTGTSGASGVSACEQLSVAFAKHLKLSAVFDGILKDFVKANRPLLSDTFLTRSPFPEALFRTAGRRDESDNHNDVADGHESSDEGEGDDLDGAGSSDSSDTESIIGLSESVEACLGTATGSHLARLLHGLRHGRIDDLAPESILNVFKDLVLRGQGRSNKKQIAWDRVPTNWPSKVMPFTRMFSVSNKTLSVVTTFTADDLTEEMYLRWQAFFDMVVSPGPGKANDVRQGLQELTATGTKLTDIITPKLRYAALALVILHLFCDAASNLASTSEFRQATDFLARLKDKEAICFKATFPAYAGSEEPTGGQPPSSHNRAAASAAAAEAVGSAAVDFTMCDAAVGAADAASLGTDHLSDIDVPAVSEAPLTAAESNMNVAASPFSQYFEHRGADHYILHPATDMPPEMNTPVLCREKARLLIGDTTTYVAALDFKGSVQQWRMLFAVSSDLQCEEIPGASGTLDWQVVSTSKYLTLYSFLKAVRRSLLTPTAAQGGPSSGHRVAFPKDASATTNMELGG